MQFKFNAIIVIREIRYIHHDLLSQKVRIEAEKRIMGISYEFFKQEISSACVLKQQFYYDMKNYMYILYYKIISENDF